MDYRKSIYLENNNNDSNNDNNIIKTLNKKDVFKDNTELLNHGYAIIKMNKDSNKIEITESNKTKEKREKLNKKKYNRKIINMIQNWNNFRDTDIELRGDISLYYNYKQEIEKMVTEDKEIEDIINERINDNKEYDYSSDEENNKYLLY